MKSYLKFKIAIFIFLITILTFHTAWAFWVWTPQTKKWINPKYAVKDTPQEQFSSALDAMERGKYEEAIAQFNLLVRYYPNSATASDAQFYIGLCNEKLKRYYQAFKAYEKVIEIYPSTSRMDEVIKREYDIGELFYEGQKRKFLGVEILPSIDCAIEIFRSIVENAPYSQYADKAQYNLGLSYEKLKDYSAATVEFEALVDKYPESPLVGEAKYQLAHCSYKASLKPEYDTENVDKAIEEFKLVMESEKDDRLKEEAKSNIFELESKKAQSSYQIAQFYEKGKKYNSAKIYYQEAVDNYPNTPWAAKALERLKVLKESRKLK